MYHISAPKCIISLRQKGIICLHQISILWELHMARLAKLKRTHDLKKSALSQTTQAKHGACVLAARDSVLVAQHSSQCISASRCHADLKEGGRSLHLPFLHRSCRLFLSFFFFMCAAVAQISARITSKLMEVLMALSSTGPLGPPFSDDLHQRSSTAKKNTTQKHVANFL